MKTAGAALIALLAGGNALGADVYTFSLASGQVLRYTSFDLDVKNGANTFAHDGPVLARGAVSTKTGFEVATMELTLSPKATDLVLGLPWAQAARIGVLDGAYCRVDRAFMAASDAAGKTLVDVSATGLLYVFEGRMSAPKFGRGALAFTIESDMKLLNVKMPPFLDSPGCRYSLFDAGCTLSKASFATASSVQAGSTAWALNCGVTNPAGWFDLGSVTFTSGTNNGISRSVRVYTPGSPAVLLLMTPLPNAPATSDTFNAYPGCDKTQATCTNKFSNMVNFGGEPYIPPPETAV